MNVDVLGCKDLILKKEIVRAAYFFGRALLSHQMLPYIELEIAMRTTISDLGSCEVTHYNDWYKARYFTIELRRHRCFKTTITTLAHEMVHLKQFAKGELSLSQDRWHRQCIDTDIIPYVELPWEIEASTLEHALYAMYVEQFGKPSN